VLAQGGDRACESQEENSRNLHVIRFHTASRKMANALGVRMECTLARRFADSPSFCSLFPDP
jgi:hypothetical protein